MAHQIRHEHEAALEHSDEQGISARKVGRDLRAELRDTRLELLGGDQDPLDIVMNVVYLHLFVLSVFLSLSSAVTTSSPDSAHRRSAMPKPNTAATPASSRSTAMPRRTLRATPAS